MLFESVNPLDSEGLASLLARGSVADDIIGDQMAYRGSGDIKVAALGTLDVQLVDREPGVNPKRQKQRSHGKQELSIKRR